MSDIKMFSVVNGKAAEIPGSTDAIEKSLQVLFEKNLESLIAFKRIKNFACVEFRPNSSKILVYVKVQPEPGLIEPGFTRDVSKIGHFGTGDLEITLSKPEDLERAKFLIQKSYNAS